eukprot:12214768-Alexandrium_andersonii.AAC.1
MSASLVGSEMCIRDSFRGDFWGYAGKIFSRPPEPTEYEEDPRLGARGQGVGNGGEPASTGL